MGGSCSTRGDMIFDHGTNGGGGFCGQKRGRIKRQVSSDSEEAMKASDELRNKDGEKGAKESSDSAPDKRQLFNHSKPSPSNDNSRPEGGVEAKRQAGNTKLNSCGHDERQSGKEVGGQVARDLRAPASGESGPANENDKTKTATSEVAPSKEAETTGDNERKSQLNKLKGE